MLVRRWEELGRPMVFGHRGASARADGNTLEAFDLARSEGADGIEFDLRLTSDDVMIIHHDDSVRGYGPFKRRRFSDLRQELPQIPTIDEMLEVSGDMILNAEIKNDPRDEDHDRRHKVTRLLDEWITENGVTERMLVTSFNGETVDQMRLVNRAVATGKLFDPRDEPNDYLRYLADRGHLWAMPYRRHLRRSGKALVEAAHRYGMAVGVWTVNRKTVLRAMADYGVAAVITDDPAKALALYT